MEQITIRLACRDDAKAVADMLICLAREIGDEERFCSTGKTIAKYGFGKDALFHCMIAEAVSKGKLQHLGLALYFPAFSTTRGQPGLYIQDLWIGEPARGKGLGRQLLARSIEHASKAWGAAYLSLTVYADNPSATEFYRRLGFKAGDNDCPMMLDGNAYQVLGSI